MGTMRPSLDLRSVKPAKSQASEILLLTIYRPYSNIFLKIGGTDNIKSAEKFMQGTKDGWSRKNAEARQKDVWAADWRSNVEALRFSLLYSSARIRAFRGKGDMARKDRRLAQIDRKTLFATLHRPCLAKGVDMTKQKVGRKTVPIDLLELEKLCSATPTAWRLMADANPTSHRRRRIRSSGAANLKFLDYPADAPSRCMQAPGLGCFATSPIVGLP